MCILTHTLSHTDTRAHKHTIHTHTHTHSVIERVEQAGGRESRHVALKDVRHELRFILISAEGCKPCWT